MGPTKLTYSFSIKEIYYLFKRLINVFAIFNYTVHMFLWFITFLFIYKTFFRYYISFKYNFIDSICMESFIYKHQNF